MVFSAIAHPSGHDRSQLLLLPEAVDDYVGPDNPVHFIEAFVDDLDLSAARLQTSVTGLIQSSGFGRVLSTAEARQDWSKHLVLAWFHRAFVCGHPGCMLPSVVSAAAANMMPVRCRHDVPISQACSILADGNGLDHGIIGTASLGGPRRPAVRQATVGSVSG